MKVTTSAGPVRSSRLMVAPVPGWGSANGGADVPMASIVDSVAMSASVRPRYKRRRGSVSRVQCSTRAGGDANGTAPHAFGVKDVAPLGDLHVPGLRQLARKLAGIRHQ